MSRYTVIASLRAQYQLSHQEAMAEGLRAHGIDVVIGHSANHVPTDKVVCWGWRLGAALRAQGKDVLVMERGYLGDRFAMTSLAWNGLNGYGEFPELKDPSRFHDNFKLAPWKAGGEYILLTGQVAGDMNLQGKDLRPWYDEQVKKAEHIYGLPTVFRPHPLSKMPNYCPKGATISRATLEQDLQGAAAVLTYNSNSAVDALIAGVPVLVADKGSMAFEVGSLPGMPITRKAREDWAVRLAWKQWSVEEIRSGEALTYLLEMEPAHG